MKRLEHKRCLVTGAARGIGEAIAARFLREGAQVILSDIDFDATAETAQRLGGTPYALDVAQESHWDRLAQDYPEMDVVVNNAGITGFETSPAPQDPENAALEDWRRVHRTNTTEPFSDAAMLFARCARRRQGQLSTYPHVRALSVYRRRRPMLRQKPPFAIIPRLWRFIVRSKG